MSFQSDLARGKKVEEYIAEYLRKKDWQNVRVIKGYKKEWDIESDSGTVEVKYDPMSHKTNNFVVEIEYGGEPSALETTQADWWVFVDNEDMYWVTPDALREILKDHKWRIRKFVGKGDRKEKRAYLVPKSKFIYSPYVRMVSHEK